MWHALIFTSTSRRLPPDPTTMGYDKPIYHLGNPKSTPYTPPVSSKKRRTSPASSKDHALIQKSNFKTSSNATSISRNVTYSRAKVLKDISDSEDEEQVTSSLQDGPSSSKSETTFEMPPEFDFSNIRAKRKSASSAVFESPDNFKVSLTTSTQPSPKVFEEPPEFDFESLRKSPTTRRCKFCRKELPQSFIEEPPTASRARFGYCRRHENATILQQGKQLGYPAIYDFTQVRVRITKLLPRIRKLLDGPDSEFLTTLRNKTSHRNVATPMSMFNVFDLTQPGYYGPRGAEMIRGIVMDSMAKEIKSNKSLSDALKFCGGVMGYISSIIVPEIGVRLIMQDMDVNWDDAKRVMKESAAYGNVINPVIEDISDGDDESENSDT
jgi:hypothetical protein